MATIKDVAKMAGVSHGTVSNVLNETDKVRPETVKKVQEAIAALGYTPDATARSLKTSRSMSVGVILPNITDPSFAQLFTGIERVLSEYGYTVTLYSTSEIPAKENVIIERICQQRMDGVVLVTCQPEEAKVFKKIEHAGIKMVFLEREVPGAEYSYLGYNNYRSIYDVTVKSLKDGQEEIVLITGPMGYSSEAQCHKGYMGAHADEGRSWHSRNMLETSFSKESAFKVTVKLLSEAKLPDVIITSSTYILQGVSKALSLLKPGSQHTPLILSLAEETWTDFLHPDIKTISRKAILLGELAAETLIENIKKPVLFESVHRSIENGRYDDEPEPGEHLSRIAVRKKIASPLRVLMLDSSAACATSALLPDFEHKTRLQVSIETLGYDDLHDALMRESLTHTYDVFQINQPWLPELVYAGCLASLNVLIKKYPLVVKDYIPGVLDTYAKYHENYFALPYMFDTQLLFYRKDLFDDPDLRTRFKQQYHGELEPPSTWKEFNLIAQFFTRRYNPDSPTLYGTTLGGKYSNGALCEFLPRQWAYEGRTFDDDGNLVLNGKETIRALQNYVESYQYASESSPNHWWQEQVEEFRQGLTAMMMLFVAHATDIISRAKSKIIGKIGYTLIPGRCPVLGGWSLGINSHSSRRREAFGFISWATCRELAIPYSILGGATPSINLYKSSELLSMYPWMPKVLESFTISRKRNVSLISTSGMLSEREYEHIIGKAVHEAILGQKTAEEAICWAARQTEKLARERVTQENQKTTSEELGPMPIARMLRRR